MMHMTRVYTTRLLEALDEDIIDKDELIRTMLAWMSEHDVKQLVLANDLQDALFYEDEDELEDAD